MTWAISIVDVTSLRLLLFPYTVLLKCGQFCWYSFVKEFLCFYKRIMEFSFMYVGHLIWCLQRSGKCQLPWCGSDIWCIIEATFRFFLFFFPPLCQCLSNSFPLTWSHLHYLLLLFPLKQKMIPKACLCFHFLKFCIALFYMHCCFAHMYVCMRMSDLRNQTSVSCHVGAGIGT